MEGDGVRDTGRDRGLVLVEGVLRVGVGLLDGWLALGAPSKAERRSFPVIHASQILWSAVADQTSIVSQACVRS